MGVIAKTTRLCDVYERTSKSGVKYLHGRMGGVTVMVMPSRDGTAGKFSILITDEPPTKEAKPAGKAPAPLKAQPTFVPSKTSAPDAHEEAFDDDSPF